MEINEIKDGDSFLVRTPNNFLSDTICKVMKKWGKKINKPTSPIYSHAARFVWIADELYLFGSVDNGYNPILFRKHYDWEESDFAIMRRKKPLTKKEVKQTTNFMLHLDTISVSYQYWNFIQWLMLVYLGIDTFKKENYRFMYCFESERAARKNLNPEKYGPVSRTDIFDLLYDPDYEIIYKSKQ